MTNTNIQVKRISEIEIKGTDGMTEEVAMFEVQAFGEIRQLEGRRWALKNGSYASKVWRVGGYAIMACRVGRQGAKAWMSPLNATEENDELIVLEPTHHINNSHAQYIGFWDKVIEPIKTQRRG